MEQPRPRRQAAPEDGAADLRPQRLRPGGRRAAGRQQGAGGDARLGGVPGARDRASGEEAPHLHREARRHAGEARAPLRPHARGPRPHQPLLVQHRAARGRQGGGLFADGRRAPRADDGDGAGQEAPRPRRHPAGSRRRGGGPAWARPTARRRPTTRRRRPAASRTSERAARPAREAAQRRGQTGRQAPRRRRPRPATARRSRRQMARARVEPALAGQRVDHLVASVVPGLSVAAARRLLATGRCGSTAACPEKASGSPPGRPSRSTTRPFGDAAGSGRSRSARCRSRSCSPTRRWWPSPSRPGSPPTRCDRASSARRRTRSWPGSRSAPPLRPIRARGGSSNRLDTATSGVLLAARRPEAWPPLRAAFDRARLREDLPRRGDRGAARRRRGHRADRPRRPAGGARAGGRRASAACRRAPSGRWWRGAPATALVRARAARGPRPTRCARTSRRPGSRSSATRRTAARRRASCTFTRPPMRFPHPVTGEPISIEAPPPAWAKIAAVSASRAIVLQHTPTEGPERVGRPARARGISTSRCGRSTTARRSPRSSTPDEMLIVMGGPMGVADAGSARVPVPGPGDRAAREAGRARRAGARDLPRLAAARRGAGARVYPNTRPGPTGRAEPAREVGWGPVDFVGVEREPALAGLAPRELVLHWHGDTFDLPPGAALLASTPVCRHQAFRLGRRQFGLQFHCELDPETIARLGATRTPTTCAPPTGPTARRRSWPTPSATTPGRPPVWDRLLGNILDPHAIVGACQLPENSRSRSSRCAARPIPTTTSRARSSACAPPPRDGAALVCLPELFRTQYFCQAEDHANFDLAEPIPGPTTAGARRGGARGGRRHHRLAVRAARGGRLPQHRRRHRRRRHASWASTARCTSPTIRSTTRSSTSRRAISASAPSTPPAAASARWSAGTSGTPRGRA